MGLELWTNYYSIDYHHHNRDTNIKTTYKIDTNPNVGATGSLWLGLEHPAVQSSSHFNSQLNYTSDFYTKPWPSRASWLELELELRGKQRSSPCCD